MHKLTSKLDKRLLLFSMLSLAALYLLLPKLHVFHGTLAAVHEADKTYLLYATTMLGAAIVMASCTYHLLAIKYIDVRKIMVLQAAGLFANRLLPAGIGGMGLMIAFLHKQRLSITSATAVVTANNTLTFIGHVLLLIITSGTLALHTDKLTTLLSSQLLYVALAIVLTSFVMVWFFARDALRPKVKAVKKVLYYYQTHPVVLAVALASAMANTCFQTLCLLFSLYAFGIELSFAQVLLVLTGGVAAATVTPTPGGLVGAEAGITFALIAYGAEPAESLAAALMYRFITYWVVLIPGFFVFLYAVKQRYV